ncbi:MAG: hypothetical protein LUC22_04930, partial [Prevotella sp.]|nr:hypothetical protein [Prevotella sp.]
GLWAYGRKMKANGVLTGLFVVVAMVFAACARRGVALFPALSRLHSTTTEYDYFFLEAVRLQNTGDYAAAFDMLQRCIEMDTLAPEAYYLLGAYYADLDEDSLATACLKRAVRLNPKNDAYHERIAQWFIQTQDYGKAIDAYEYLYANNKSRTDVLDLLIRLYQQKKDYNGMLRTLERYEQAEGISEETTLTKMQIYQQKGERQKAQHALQELCDTYPNDVNVKVMMGNWLQQNGRSDEARAIFLEAERTDPTNEYVATSLYDYYRAQGEDSLAIIYRDRILLNRHTAASTKNTMLQAIMRENERQGRDSSEVLALFDDILRADSANADVAELKAVYMKMKNMPREEVDSALRYVLAIAPDRVGSRLQLLQSEWRAENTDAIIEVCRPALIYNPEETSFCYYLGLAYFQRGDTLEALNTFRLGTSRINDRTDTELAGDFYVLIGDIVHQTGDKDEAYAAYDSCLQYVPEHVACLNNYAYFLSIDGGDLKKAEGMSLKAINIEPNNATYIDTYAWILYLEERYSEAKEFIDRTIENLDSAENNSTLYDHAGDIYEACGDIAGAVGYWKQALASEPDDAAAIRKKIRKYEE